MKKRLPGYLFGFIVLLVGGWLVANPYEPLSVPMGESVYDGPRDDWQPTRTQIAEALQAARFSGEMEKLTLFSDLFKQRYREQSLPYHCRVVEQDGQIQIRLFCAGVMPRWYTARVARSLWEEARQHAGYAVPVTIYESNIFQDPRYIGRCYLPENGSGMEVQFIERSTYRIPRSGSPRWGRGDPSVNRNEGIFRPPVKSGSRSRF